MSFHILPETPIRRRDFLAGAAALGVAASVSRGDSTESPAWFALLSDTHIEADPKTVSRNHTMARNLETVIAEILHEKVAPTGLLIDGDLTLKDGQSGDYKTLLNLLEPIRKAKLPIHLALGNHDNRSTFRETLKGSVPVESRIEEKQVGAFETLGLRMVVLDSLDEPNVTPGELGEAQLAWLGRELDAKGSTPTLVFVHHNLKAAAEAGLTDHEALLKVIGPRKQVKAVIFGHTHTWDVRQSEGIYLVNLPAIGYPFSPKQPIGWTKLTPSEGGATLQLHAIGGERSKHGEKIQLTWRTA